MTLQPQALRAFHQRFHDDERRTRRRHTQMRVVKYAALGLSFARLVQLLLTAHH